jgi:5-methyltetrahydropteroyltriglutamate--homocysteine methyltransferase
MSMMRTTVIGSYPLRHSELGRDAVRQAVEEQLSAGIRLVTDGQTRGDMILVYAGALKGTEVKAEKGPSGGEGKLHITGKVEPGGASIFVEDYLEARKAAGKRAGVKVCITGPATLVFSSILETKHYKGYRDRALYMDVASALLSLARALEKAGATQFQLDEPFFSVGVPMDLAQEAVESISSGLKGEMALHVCGDVSKVFDRLLTFKGIGLLSHGFAGTPSNLGLVSREKLEKAGKLLGFGCIDTASERVESEQEVLDLIKKGISKVGAENMVVHPDCGLRALPLDVARAKLGALGGAVRRL